MLHISSHLPFKKSIGLISFCLETMFNFFGVQISSFVLNLLLRKWVKISSDLGQYYDYQHAGLFQLFLYLSTFSMTSVIHPVVVGSTSLTLKMPERNRRNQIYSQSFSIRTINTIHIYKHPGLHLFLTKKKKKTVKCIEFSLRWFLLSNISY